MIGCGGLKKKNSIILILMDPDNNCGHPHYKPNGRIPERPVPGAYPGLPSVPGNIIPYNYMYSAMQPLYYPTYPYSSYPYSNSPYLHGNTPQWRQNGYAAGGLGSSGNYPHSFPIQQNSRVTLWESRDKQQHEVINLESDDESKLKVNPPQSPPNNLKKLVEKPKNFIEIEDNSPLKIRIPYPSPPPKIQSPISAPKKTQEDKSIGKLDKTEKIQKLNKLQKIQKPKKLEKIQRAPRLEKLQKIDKQQIRLKPVRTPKAEPQYIKTKNIRKTHRKSLYDVSKEEKSSRQKQKIEELRLKQNNKDKQIEKTNQKKQERSQKKIQQTPKKVDETSTREIAKYMDSHGEIRHGKQFQSTIPQMHTLFAQNHRKWIEIKRLHLLNREIGPRTF